MVDNLAYLGIFPESINNAIETCKHVLEENGFNAAEINRVEQDASDDLLQINFTNAIIESYFNATKEALKNKYPDLDVDYYVNCIDSSFFVNGELQ